VKSPEGLRNTEKVKNDFQGAVASSTRAPNVRGEFSQATREYFKLLSGVSYAGQKTEQPKTGETGSEPPADPMSEATLETPPPQE
jgi:hypothetical protein